MKVKLKTCYASPEGIAAHEGDIIEVKDLEGESLVRLEYAEKIIDLSEKEKEEIVTKAEESFIETAEVKKFKKHK